MNYLMQYDDILCECGECDYCKTLYALDLDCESKEYLCITCNGDGCIRCEGN